MIGDHLVGPWELPPVLTGENYLEFLQNDLPDLLDQVLTRDEQDNMIFMHVGAPAHYSFEVRQYLDQCFGEAWIERQGGIEWPPRSPDLNPLDYFYWGYSKEVVYHRDAVATVEELRQKIHDHADTVTPAMVHRATQNIISRAQKCINEQMVQLLWSFVCGLQRPPPRYSQQYMPQTSFTCRNKIIGSYYADPETDCQLFHVCVSIAGNVQDYRFLCPNDTAFDQESQTCADWYDVDCEAATLYYASDNFDLYRLGSGLESVHYDSIRNDFEPQDHLQRSESNDPIRSPLNSFNSKDNYKDSEISKNSKQVTIRNQKIINSEQNKDKNIDLERKVNVRKVNRKTVNNSYTNTYNIQSTTTTIPYTTKFNQVLSSLRATMKYTTTTARSNINLKDTHNNDRTATTKNNFQNYNNLNRFEMTAKPKYIISTESIEQNYSGHFNQASALAVKQSVANYQQHSQGVNFDSYNNKNDNNYYNSIQKTNSSLYSATTISPNTYNTYNSKDKKYNLNEYTTNIYAPTTFIPTTNKISNNRQYYHESATLTTKNIQNTGIVSSKVSQKVTHYNKGHQNYGSTTGSYDIGRSSIGLGFSPSSINHLAENIRSTTPSSRSVASPTTYNPNNFGTNINISQSQVNKQKSIKYQNPSTKQYSTTAKYYEETSTRKIMKKNDYDYAYYDNGPLEYDNIEFEHVTSNKESVKIT